MSRKRPLPKTTDECQQLLELILDFAESLSLAKEEVAMNAVDRLGKKRCTKALVYIVHEFTGDYGPKGRLAARANKFL